MSEIRREIIKNENNLLLIKSIQTDGTAYFVDEVTREGGFNRKYANKNFIKALNVWYEIAQGVKTRY